MCHARQKALIFIAKNAEVVQQWWNRIYKFLIENIVFLKH